MKEKKYGEITIKLDDIVINKVDILAENSIRKKQIGDYFTSLLTSFLLYYTNNYIKSI